MASNKQFEKYKSDGSVGGKNRGWIKTLSLGDQAAT